MHLTLSQAAKHVGINKATLSRYSKQGKISATKQADGSYHIDPSELDRLRALMGAATRGDLHADTRDDTPKLPTSHTGTLALLRELLAEKDRTMAEKDRMIANLMQERDEWREQWKKQLLLLPLGTPPQKKWWRVGKG